MDSLRMKNKICTPCADLSAMHEYLIPEKGARRRAVGRHGLHFGHLTPFKARPIVVTQKTQPCLTSPYVCWAGSRPPARAGRTVSLFNVL